MVLLRANGCGGGAEAPWEEGGGTRKGSGGGSGEEVGVSEEEEGVAGATGVRLSGGRGVRWGLVVSDSGCSCSPYGDVCPPPYDDDDVDVCSVCVGAGAAGDASAVVGVAGESREEAGLAWDRCVCVRWETACGCDDRWGRGCVCACG